MVIKNSKEFMEKVVAEYSAISGKRIIESLKKFSYKHELSDFVEACLSSIKEYCEGAEDKITLEEVLAILVRFNIMLFVEKRVSQNMWYLILTKLLPEELQKVKPSEFAQKMEDKFIEFMEMLEETQGNEAVKQSIMNFLFKENKKITLTALDIIQNFTEKIQKVLN
jgi:hypothetical protein